jgi:hypothetical protein
MLELTGLDSVIRGVSYLYWGLAIFALLAVVWKAKRPWNKVIGSLAVLVVFGFLPAKQWFEAREREAYAREAWNYFKKKCVEDASQKILRTFTDVKSVVVTKSLPPATEKDLYDQFWYGDPYSLALEGKDRTQIVAGRLITTLRLKKDPDNEERGFEFVEIRTGESYERIFPLREPPFIKKDAVASPSSRFGVTWEDISTPEDRKHWVAGSRLRVVDLTDNSVVAERIGFLIEAGFGSTAGARRPWLAARGPNTTCPSLKNGDFEDRWFIFKALSPIKESRNGK